MTFHAFLQTKYPLYSDTEIKVNLTVQQLCELVEEFIMIEIDDLTSEDLARLDKGLKDIAQGKTTNWDDVKYEFIDDEDEDFEDEDFDPLEQQAINCKCHSFVFGLDGLWHRVADCTCD